MAAASVDTEPRKQPRSEPLRSPIDQASHDLAVRFLDPELVQASQWSNRHASAFTNAQFQQLKASIEAVGRNLQPIKVRPLAAPSGPTSENPLQRYEIVFGHRRHRACLELGLSVTALIAQISDQELFVEMDRENRDQRSLSAFEQGAIYRQALDKGLYPSARSLAQAIGVDASMVSKSMTIAQLPPEVIEAFPSPVDIQYRWAGPLQAACMADRKTLIAKAEVISGQPGKLSSVRVFQALVGATHRSESTIIAGPGGRASIATGKNGHVIVRFETIISPSVRTAVERVLKEALG